MLLVNMLFKMLHCHCCTLSISSRFIKTNSLEAVLVVAVGGNAVT